MWYYIYITSFYIHRLEFMFIISTTLTKIYSKWQQNVYELSNWKFKSAKVIAKNTLKLTVLNCIIKKSIKIISALEVNEFNYFLWNFGI